MTAPPNINERVAKFEAELAINPLKCALHSLLKYFIVMRIEHVMLERLRYHIVIATPPQQPSPQTGALL